MGKKSDARDLEVARYRWKFLRRNQEYKRDYLEFEKMCKKNDIDCIGIERFENKLCKKWKLGAIYNPEESFDIIFNYISLLSG